MIEVKVLQLLGFDYLGQAFHVVLLLGSDTEDLTVFLPDDSDLSSRSEGVQFQTSV